MKRYFAKVAGLAAALTLAISGTAMGAELLRANVPDAGLGYASNGTFEALGVDPNTVNAICDQGVPNVWSTEYPVWFEVCGNEPKW